MILLYNLKKISLIILGSLLVIICCFFIIYKKYEHLNKPHIENKISKSHFSLSLIFSEMNEQLKKIDIIGLVRQFILINTNLGYQELSNICLTIYYSLYTYRNGMKEGLIEKMQDIGCVLILLYYIKQSIDDWYSKREKEML
jgi:hypothetical protein